MSNLNYKQVVNVERRTWDVEAYEKKAKLRQNELEEQEKQGSSGRTRKTKSNNKNEDGSAFVAGRDDEDKPEFRPAAPGGAGPEGSERAYLRARSGRVTDIDSRVGTIEIVSAEAAATTKSQSPDDPKQGVVKTGIGWHCKVCDCFLKDSHTYLDHINGRKHQKKLGFSMRVERSSKDDVMAKLKALAEKKEVESLGQQMEEETDFNEIVKAKDEELRKRREERKKRRKERKTQGTTEEKEELEPVIGKTDQEDAEGISNKEGAPSKLVDTPGNEEKEEDEEPEIDPNLAAMMGFAGFGSSKS